MPSKKQPPTSTRSALLSGVQLRNFKSVGEADIALSGLTVLVGSNSAGKTTLLQSILMRALPSRGVNWTRDGAISLNQAMANLGAFNRLKFDQAAKDDPLQVGGELLVELNSAPDSWLREVDMNFMRSQALKGLDKSWPDMPSKKSLDLKLGIRWLLGLEEAADSGSAGEQTFKAQVSTVKVSIFVYIDHREISELEPPGGPIREVPLASVVTAFKPGNAVPRGSAINELLSQQRYRQGRSLTQFVDEKGPVIGETYDAANLWGGGTGIRSDVVFAEARDGLPVQLWLAEDPRTHVAEGLLRFWTQLSRPPRLAAQRRRNRGEEEEIEKSVQLAQLDPKREAELRDQIIQQAVEWCNAYLLDLERAFNDEEDPDMDAREPGRFTFMDPADWFFERSAGPQDNPEEMPGVIEIALDPEMAARTRRRLPGVHTPGGPDIESLHCFQRTWGGDEDRDTLRKTVAFVAEQLKETPFVDTVRESRGMAALCTVAEQIVSKYFDTQIFHIGPLRQPPKWTQADVEALRPRSVGTEGENTVSQLVHYGTTQVRCPGLSSDEPSFDTTLKQAVDHWMGEGGLDLFESHQAEPLDGLVQTFRMRLRGKEVERHLPEVGVGVSQVLPVVVQCLLAEPGSLILLQQPELHLHPALQQRLGNFLLACVRSGRQVVLETHSEYLVSRLALEVAKDPSDETRDMLAVLLTEVGDNGTEYVSADIDRYGEIVWPRGFFDEGASEALQILQAGIRKQQQDAQG